MECQEFTDGQGITHRLWTVTSPSVIEKIVSDFKDRKIYIADGHHRYETALNYRNYCRENGLAKEGDGVDYQMIFLADMDHPGLKVFPTHRLVRDLENFDEEAFLKNVRKTSRLWTARIFPQWKIPFTTFSVTTERLSDMWERQTKFLC